MRSTARRKGALLGRVRSGGAVSQQVYRKQHVVTSVVAVIVDEQETRAVVPNPCEVAEARWVPRPDLGSFPMPDGARYIVGRLFREHHDPELRNLKHGS